MPSAMIWVVALAVLWIGPRLLVRTTKRRSVKRAGPWILDRD
jgi:hypothetical protein